jgi:hypothetical protein
MLVSTCFAIYYYCHLLVSHPTKMNMYTALQNENGVRFGNYRKQKTTDNALWMKKL